MPLLWYKCYGESNLQKLNTYISVYPVSMAGLMKMVFGPVNTLELFIYNNIDLSMCINAIVVVLVLSIYIPILSMLVCLFTEAIRIGLKAIWMGDTTRTKCALNVGSWTMAIIVVMIYMLPIFGCVTLSYSLIMRYGSGRDGI